MESGERLEDLVRPRPYYDPEVAARHNPCAGIMEELYKEHCPEVLLPATLLEKPVSTGTGGGPGAPVDAEGAGTGGWTALKRFYEPSPDPGVRYDSYSGYADNYIIDVNGARHDYYVVGTETDTSEPPDAPGFVSKSLDRHMYSTWTEGTWSTPSGITPAAGKQDTAAVLFDADADGYLHLVYSRWEWGRNPAYPAGDAGAYMHYNERLYYRYRAPNGTWSEPESLTAFAGAMDLQGGQFILLGEKVYGAWYEIIDRGTMPVSYTVRVRYIEGSKKGWESPETVAQWDTAFGPGEKVPYYVPIMDVSQVTGEAAVVYSVGTVGATPPDGRVNIYSALRSPGGAWSLSGNLTSMAAGYIINSFMLRYGPDGLNPKVIAMGYRIPDGVARGPQSNFYTITCLGGEWQQPLSLTALTGNQAAGALDLSFDPWGRVHIATTAQRYEWNPGILQWELEGESLRYSHEVGGTESEVENLLSYSAGRYTDAVSMELDGNGAARIIYETHLTDPVEGTDYRVSYVDNRSGTFPGPTRLNQDTANRVYDVVLEVNQADGALASWFEYRTDPGGVPQAAALYSRYMDGGSWGPRVNATGVPGGDIVKLTGTAPYFNPCIDWAGTPAGELSCLFETSGTKKYYNETVNGAWGAPQLVSSSSWSGWPYILRDANQRVHALIEYYDGANGKSELYSSMQREPTPPAGTYFFAEGTTRPGFQEWLCLQNPGDTAAAVEITYMLGTGENRVQTVEVAAHSRLTVDVNAFVGPWQDVSTRVTSDSLLVAERPIYFTYGDGAWPGGHDALGSVRTARRWYFAEGTTRREFAEYLTLQNPSAVDAVARVTYMFTDGTTSGQDVPVAARSRATVDVRAAVGEGRDVSMKVESPDAGIVAERPMYFDYREQGWTGGHNAMGSTGLDSRWYFAEGTTREGFDTYLCVQNPNGSAGSADITYLLGDGSTVTRKLDLPATSRQTVRVNDDVAAGSDVSIVLDATVPVLAERPMYFNFHGASPGGHVAVGAVRPKNSWYFAEGTTRPGFEEWLALENPGGRDTGVKLTYMLEDGSVVNQDVNVPAHTRVTVDVRAAVGEGRDVSVAVWGALGIIAERSMYFVPTAATPAVQPGGTNVMGL